MRAVLQRVSQATIVVNNELVATIQHGLLVYFGVERNDSNLQVDYMAKKIPRLRLFSDGEDKMNLSVQDVGGAILVVSQFTLCADLTKGNRPSFNPAADTELAILLYENFVKKLREQNLEVATGIFGASMQVSYTNDGPVTLILDSPENLK